MRAHRYSRGQPRRAAPSLFPDPEAESPPGDVLDQLGIDCNSPGWPDVAGIKLRQAATELLRPIRTLSLFSGGGGLDIGFHDAGFDVAEAVEIDARCVKVLAHNAGCTPARSWPDA